MKMPWINQPVRSAELTSVHEDDLCLHQLIEQRLRHAVNRTAVVFEEDRLTHGELHRRARRLAEHLTGLGAGPDVRVGLFVEPSVALIVAILGILKSGAAYVPIDAASPPERIGFLVRDAGIRLLLTDSHLLSHLPRSITEDVTKTSQKRRRSASMRSTGMPPNP